MKKINFINCKCNTPNCGILEYIYDEQKDWTTYSFNCHYHPLKSIDYDSILCWHKMTGFIEDTKYINLYIFVDRLENFINSCTYNIIRFIFSFYLLFIFVFRDINVSIDCIFYKEDIDYIKNNIFPDKNIEFKDDNIEDYVIANTFKIDKKQLSIKQIYDFIFNNFMVCRINKDIFINTIEGQIEKETEIFYSVADN